MSLWNTVTGWVPKLFGKSSRGERILMSVLPTYNGIPATWAQNRAELANHFRGWNYVAIRAICEEIAGLHPHVAYVRDGQEAAQARAKALGLRSAQRRRAELALLNAKYLGRQARMKALASVMPHEELEPVKHNHPLLKLLRKPNVAEVSWSFFYRLTMYLEMMGVGYIWIVNNNAGDPAELWVLPSHWVRKIPGSTELVDHFEVRPALGYTVTDYGFGWFPGGSGQLELPPEAVIEIAYPHPTNPFDGYSALTACSDWVDSSDSIDRSRVSHFQNGWFPGVCVEIDKEVADPDPNQIARFQAEIQARYQGVLKNKKPVVLAPGMRLVPMSQTPEEMDYVASADQIKTFLLAAHRTGPSVAGLAEQTTYASMVAATANFYRGTIKPKLSFLGQVLTERLGSRYEDSPVVYWPDPTLDDPDQKLRQYQATPGPAVTVNEYRQNVLGLDPLESGGDDPLAPLSLSPIPMGTGDEAEDLPVPALAAQKQEQAQPPEGSPSGAPEEGGLPTALGQGNDNPADRLLTGRNGLNGNGKVLNGTH